MGIAQQFTQAREAALRSATIDAEATGEFGPVERDVPGATITVLSTDTELYESVRRAVLEQHEISPAADLEQAAELAAAGKCAILITDQAMTAEASAHITERLRKHESALVSIAIGNRGQDSVLLGLMSSAVVDRFMLKPITPALARIVIESAAKEHYARKPHRPEQVTPEFTMRRPAAAAKRRERDSDKTAITQPVKVLPSRERREPVEAAPEVVAREESVAEHPEDLTVVVPTLDASPAASPSGQAEEHREIPPAPVEATETRTGAAEQPFQHMEPRHYVPGVTSSSPFQSGLPRPPWIVLIAAVAAVAGLVWWIMLQRLPDIDPRALIGSNLSAGRTALAEKRYVEPPDRSAFHHFSMVLALDPANAEAQAGLDRIADDFVEHAQSLIAEGRFAEAVSALQSVRRVRPEHARVASLEAQLREQLARQFPQIRKPPALDPQPVPVAAARPSESSPVEPAKSSNPSPVIRSARVAEPRPAQRESAHDAPVQQDAAGSGMRMIADARAAIERKDFDVARALLNAALESGAAPGEWMALNESLIAAEQSVAKVESAPLPAVVEPAQQVPAAPDPVAAAPSLPEPPAAPVLVKMVRPRYPNEARLRGIEGWVDLSFAVSAAGDVIEPRVEDSSMKHLFARPALAAVSQWKYQPRAAGGDPAHRTWTRVVFRLQE
jgi:TonB family protein